MQFNSKAILSINDHPDMRKIFKRFPMETVAMQYCAGGGGKAVKRSELVITSWETSQLT